MAAGVESAAEAMRNARSSTSALSETAERLRRLIAHFRLTGAQRQSVNITVAARCATWSGSRSARIVDMSATGARIEGLHAPEGSELHLTFVDPATRATVQRRASVKRSAIGDNGPWVGIAFIADQDLRAA